MNDYPLDPNFLPEIASDWVGLVASVALVVFLASVAATRPIPRALKVMLCAGLALRVVGAFARYGVIFGLYNGQGDAAAYYDLALDYAGKFGALDFSPLFDRSQWRGATWWGTQFVHYPTAVVVSLIGPNIVGAFVVFSLLAFGGLAAFVAAFRRAYPDVPAANYARWIYLFPSLWFWPSSVGKEAITMLGFGLATLGFVGKGGRVQWPTFALGILVVFTIRPQVAAVVLLAAILAQWLSAGERWTPGRLVQGVLILGVGLVAIQYSLKSAGVGSFDAEGVQGYMRGDASRRLGGGSGIEAAQVGWSGVPLALVNVLLRPFPWEAGSAMALLSSVEILGFWAVAWWRRDNLVRAVRHWRSDRFTRFAVPFVLIYSVTLGMMLSNLGIIARQRVPVFPFLFLLVEAVPRRAGVRQRRPAQVGDWADGPPGPLGPVRTPIRV